MLKRKSYKLQLITILGLLFSGSAFAEDIAPIEKECKNTGKNFIQSIKETMGSHFPNGMKIYDADIKSIPNMDVRINYANKKYKVKCKKKKGRNMNITVEVVVEIDEGVLSFEKSP